MPLPQRRAAAMLHEFGRVVLLRDVTDAGFGHRTYPAGTTGVVVDSRRAGHTAKSRSSTRPTC